MRPSEDIKRLIGRSGIKIDPEVKKDSLTELVGELERVNVSREAVNKSNMWRVIMNSAIAMFVAAMVFAVVTAINRPAEPVAALTDSINAEWGEAGFCPVNGDVMRPGKFVLVKGLAEITFNDGAVVVVEGPAKIELESSVSMSLWSGKIYAVVSQYAVGFMVNTPSAIAVDLGTEFGISVAGNGSCDLHVFDGSVNLLSRGAGTIMSTIVKAKQARRVDRRTSKVITIQWRRNGFVSFIDSSQGIIQRGEEPEQE